MIKNSMIIDGFGDFLWFKLVRMGKIKALEGDFVEKRAFFGFRET